MVRRMVRPAKQRRESRVLVHKACVVCFLGRLRLLSRWCDDDVATTAAVVGGTGVLLLVLATKRLRKAVALQNVVLDGAQR